MNKDSDYTFSHTRVVMVDPTEAGNIGAAARAMKNMCLSRLYLVRPQNYPSATATARASGADDVLQNAIVCQTLAETIKDCHLVIGASARQRSIKWQTVDVIEACEQIIQVSNTPEQQVAIVFGTENSGLTNKQLDLCQVLMSIPGNPEYFSLNVAQAIQVFAYQLYSSHQVKAPQTINETLANTTEITYFYQHLEQVLHHLDYLDKHRVDELLMRRLRKLFSRTQLQKDEVAILRGILTKICKFKD